MGALLKADLRYTKLAWLIAYAISLAFLAAAVVVPRWDIFAHMTNTTITYFIVMGIIGLEGDEEKRTRANALLPLRPRQLALLDIAYVTLFHLGMVALWLALLLFKPQLATPRTFWGMATQSGLTLALITIFGIYTHLGYFGEKPYRQWMRALVMALGSTMAALVYTGWIGTVMRFVGRHYVSWTGALTSMLLFLALAWFSVIVYERRRSYLA